MQDGRQGSVAAFYAPSRRIPGLLAVCKDGVVSLLVYPFSSILKQGAQGCRSFIKFGPRHP